MKPSSLFLHEAYLHLSLHFLSSVHSVLLFYTFSPLLYEYHQCRCLHYIKYIMSTACPICETTVQEVEDGIDCDRKFQCWFHRTCLNMAETSVSKEILIQNGYTLELIALTHPTNLWLNFRHKSQLCYPISATYWTNFIKSKLFPCILPNKG